MQAVLLTQKNGPLIVGTTVVPLPGPGEVLIRMAAAPINPSDLGFLKGSYKFQKPFPLVPGLEGSGTVVAAGPGLLPRLLVGKRVACSSPLGGTWAEYFSISASRCFPISRTLSLEQGATLIVNPLTAMAFFEIARREKHAAIVSNAAASALGQMILRLGKTYDLPVIHIVRRREQVELLRSLGGEYILNSQDPDVYEQLGRLSRQLKATLILDPVGGEQTYRLLETAPGGSTLLTYGSLSGKSTDVAGLSARDTPNRIRGFFLPDWLATKNLIQILLDLRRVQRLATNVLQTTIHKRLPLPEVQKAIEVYQANPTAGKVLLVADPEEVPIEPA